MQEFNANLRNAIARGLTPGPRLFVATKVLASTGSFELRTENCAGGHCLPAGADAVDGVEQCRQAQPPYIPGVLHPPKEPNPDYMVFSQEEMDMIVKEAALARAPVSEHCCTLEGVSLGF
ncbi:hypothetical protein BJX68DRAFT_261608 [Aspergillus pseudodeflectus]|uniref:Uncharacterized protein n=1 Tax=Aspergillus pseudodeflectus TaxID=176178 RepID=A0ABR4L3U1_9EURO